MDDAKNLHDTTDAAKWAAEFCKRWPSALCQIPGKEGVSDGNDFEAIMIGWFANAIMSGVDSEARKAAARIRELEAQTALLQSIVAGLASGDMDRMASSWHAIGFEMGKLAASVRVADAEARAARAEGILTGMGIMGAEPSAAQSPAPAVKVKPLVWEEWVDAPVRVLSAQTVIGRYKVQERANGAGWMLVFPNGNLTNRDTEEAAKAAAQADYDARILAAIEAVPAAEVWRRAMEAAALKIHTEWNADQPWRKHNGMNCTEVCATIRALPLPDDLK
jgi:hypothetical protein